MTSPLRISLVLAALALAPFARAQSPAPIGPQHCFQNAMHLQAELDALRAARGVADAVPAAEPVKDKKPADCFQQARGLLEDLGKVGLGGAPIAVPPTPKDAPIKPADVNGLLQSALLHVQQMKQKAGSTAAVAAPELAVPKTPSDVFAQIVRARHLARSLVPK